jgi:hypothetical protein
VKTEELIALLASDATPLVARGGRQRFQTALLLGGLGALVVMQLGYGVRHDLAHALALPMFWVKLAFPLGVVIPALVLTFRLAHPGTRLGRVWMLLPLPWLVVAAMALWVVLNAPTADRLPLLLGQTWVSCAFSIALISTPVLVGVLWAVKGLAPTRPALAGACAGLASGAAGALVYALHCTELQAPFLAIWYLLGMLIPAGVGALLSNRLLRW